MDIKNIKKEFPIFKQKINGKPLVYLDSANSSQKPKVVIDKISNFYETEFSNVGRSVHTLAVKATNRFEATRDKVQKYLNAKYREEIIFTKGATEAINLVASSYGKKYIKKGDEVLITELEHHSNYVPWDFLRTEKGAVIKFAQVNEGGDVEIEEIKKLITNNFDDHPGDLENTWFPVNRAGAEKQLDNFLKVRFENFGIYEDAMLEEKNFLFHSCISPFLNIGLLTPDKVIKKTLQYAEKNNVPMNSVEGFVRQIIGWREFIRGIYHEEGALQSKSNYWKHSKKLTSSWYDGTTGIDPLDDCIKTTLKDGYIHHIPRLMVISNIMNLCGVDPKEIYKWFMEMYIDSSDWVMVPNVFGMATYADGGMMSTKPYTCGSNYILKMSNYKKGDWCDTLDGLYWKFTEKNRKFYENNPRLTLLTRSLDRLNPERKNHIFKKAEDFIKQNTI